mmetsp:Transcript_30634/g.67092  ORF Transcript_30634/g.67092 Transcript_30634/m.67092 type:complete len:283 (-) Transcript_30634:132-980(-)
MVDDGVSCAAGVHDTGAVVEPVVVYCRSHSKRSSLHEISHHGQLLVAGESKPSSHAEIQTGLHRLLLSIEDSWTGSVDALVGKLLLRAASVLHNVVHSQLSGGPLTAPSASALMGVVDAGHQLLERELAVLAPDLRVRPEQHAGGEGPAASALLLILDLLDSVEVLPADFLGEIGTLIDRGPCHEIVHLRAGWCRGAGVAVVAALCCEFLRSAVREAVHSRRPSLIALAIMRINIIKVMEEEFPTPVVLLGPFCEVALVLFNKDVKRIFAAASSPATIGVPV